jgi:hypothetical protein
MLVYYMMHLTFRLAIQAVSESLLHEKGEEFKTVEWIKLNERSRVTLQI